MFKLTTQSFAAKKDFGGWDAGGQLQSVLGGLSPQSLLGWADAGALSVVCCYGSDGG